MDYFKRALSQAQEAIENLSSEYDEVVEELQAAKERIDELEEENSNLKTELEDCQQ